MTEFIKIAPLKDLLTHTRFLLTLRAKEGTYRSLILFRLATAADDALASHVRASSSQSGNPPGPSSHIDRPDSDEERRGYDQIYVMESACPHLGADLSHADIEECDDGVVAVCPWHRYDFDLRTGKSDTGLKACTYGVDVRLEADGKSVWIETPDEGTGWQLVELRPVSEEFADPPLPPDISKLSLSSNASATPHENNRVGEELEVVPADHPPKTLIEWAVLILNTANPRLKVQRTRHAVNLFRTGKLASIGRSASAPKPPDMPPREESMKMTDPGHAPKRKSRVAMLHALANIEQWAIDLAWDIIARFGPSHPSLPHQFFSDFTKIALDESKHFTLLCNRLAALGTHYGSLTVHAGLWQSAAETSISLKARLAIIHLVHEARGLDVNPATIEKFRRQGDKESVEVLEIIHHDEITHVTAGHRWFTHLCSADKEDPVHVFREEVRRHFAGALKGPFNEADRRKAGLTPDFYEDLKGEADRYVNVEYEGAK
ncbi:DUF455-domain-containing protein [Rickenella mellea]|uniref:DUF455-domain-containing protein n=1 Tax=Rickenella mellea TaxID=50990 RepID=A0A4Y7Q9K9_9AGAM|nr:DUF455-domain-containing protein [Rickenella mellea]